MIESSIALLVAGALLQELVAWVRSRWKSLDGDLVRAVAIVLGIAVCVVTPALRLGVFLDVVAFGYPWLDVLLSGLVMALGASLVNRIIRSREPS